MTDMHKMKMDIAINQANSVNSSVEKFVLSEYKINAGNVMYSINCVMTWFAFELRMLIFRLAKPIAAMI